MNILFIAPHPDDLEIFCGGQVRILAAGGHNVSALIMSRGECGVWEEKYKDMTEEESSQIRQKETEAGARILGIEEVRLLNYPDTKIPLDKGIINHIKIEIKRINPNVVYAPEACIYKTYYPSRDHLRTGKVVQEAVKLLEKKPRLFFYHSLCPNALVDIDKARKIKERAISKHRSQRKLLRRSYRFQAFFMRFFGLLKKAKYAEGYREVKL